MNTYLYDMELDKKEAHLLDRVIALWQQSALIDEEKAKQLQDTYTRRESNLGTLAIYAFIAALSCGLLAFGSLVLDEKWIELLRKQFGVSEVIVSIIFLLLTFLLTYWVKRRKQRYPEAGIANESFLITVVMSFGVAMVYLGRSLGYSGEHYIWLILLAAIGYGALAFYLKSPLLWVVMIIALAGFWGAATYEWQDKADYFLGMNYPLRMSLFGILVVLAAFALKRLPALGYVQQTSLVTGWLLLLIAAWTLSIFGNYSSYEAWSAIRQGRLWPWALAYTILLIAVLWYAVRQKDDTLRDIILIFFLVNIYTRYFEYFWDRTNKGLFFALLAVSFWWLGKKAERWRKQLK